LLRLFSRKDGRNGGTAIYLCSQGQWKARQLKRVTDPVTEAARKTLKLVIPANKELSAVNYYTRTAFFTAKLIKRVVAISNH